MLFSQLVEPRFGSMEGLHMWLSSIWGNIHRDGGHCMWQHWDEQNEVTSSPTNGSIFSQQTLCVPIPKPKEFSMREKTIPRHQSSYSQLMIGVSFSTETKSIGHLGSMKPFSGSVSQDPVGNWFFLRVFFSSKFRRPTNFDGLTSTVSPSSSGAQRSQKVSNKGGQAFFLGMTEESRNTRIIRNEMVDLDI